MRHAALIASTIGVVTWCAAIAPVHAQPAPGSFFIRGSLGAATQSMRDWRQLIDDQRDSFAARGVSKWDNIGTAIVPGFELGFMVSDIISVGAGVSRQKGVSDDAFADQFGSYAQKIEVSAFTLTGNASLWPRGSDGLFVGANAGFAFGEAIYEAHSRSFGDPSENYDEFGTWDGSGLAAGLFMGWEEPIGRTGIGFFRMSYQLANLGVFDGRLFSPQFGTQNGPPLDAAGQPFDTDFSGFGLHAGFGLRLGATDEPDVPGASSMRNAREPRTMAVGRVP